MCVFAEQLTFYYIYIYVAVLEKVKKLVSLSTNYMASLLALLFLVCSCLFQWAASFFSWPACSFNFLMCCVSVSSEGMQMSAIGYCCRFYDGFFCVAQRLKPSEAGRVLRRLGRRRDGRYKVRLRAAGACRRVEV